MINWGNMKGLSSFGIYVLGILDERKKHSMLNGILY